MVFPLRVDDVENDAAFEPANEVGAELFFFFLVACGDSFDGGVGKFVVAQRGGIGTGGFGVNAELGVYFGEELRSVPLIGMLVAGAKGVDELTRNRFSNFENIVALVFAFERGTANIVNRLALLVHYIVVFEKVFAGVEVLRFHGLLRVFDAARDKAGFDGDAFGHAEAEHESFHAFAAENAHEVVFEREEKARGAWVALTAGASAKLVVDAAGFVAFGAENVEAAESDDFIVFGFALL